MKLFQYHFIYIYICVCLFVFFRVTPAAYGGSQATSNPSCCCRPTPVTATPDPSRISDLHHSSQQRQILNPLKEARNPTHNLVVPSWIHFFCTTMGTPLTSFYIIKPKIRV